MTIWTLILPTLRFHMRSHLGPLLGSAIGSAVLIGALIVGDSVRGSLRDMALARLGKTRSALVAGERFVRAKLASEVSDGATNLTAPVLVVAGTMTKEDRTQRANHVQVMGVDERFWKFGAAVSGKQPEADTVLVNRALADHIHLKVGETILLRVQKPSALSREAPISPQEDFSVALRLRVDAIVSEEELGRFSLQANQVAPFNAFVSLAVLQAKLELSGRANLLLADNDAGLNGQLRQHFTFADAEAEVRQLTNSALIELRSSRIFLDEPIIAAAKAADPDASQILTYFVNELRVGDKSTPYSMVTAAESPFVPRDLAENEIVINQWVADDLAAKPGDELRLRYFVLGTTQRLEEKTNAFRIKAIVPLEGIYADRELMPEFPGIAKAEKTENWDAGFAIDTGKIRPKDEKYWKDYRGTPKAFVTVAAGQKMWANRFGSLTALRFNGSSVEQISSALQHHLDPASLALQFRDARSQALAAAEQSENFGDLFLGFSFFLIIAAILLIALLFQFAVEQRADEIGTLLAFGFTPRKVRRILLLEGTAIAILGGLIGGLGGIVFSRAMLHGLTTIWRSAVGTSSLHFHVTPLTLVAGFSASVILSTLTIWWVLRKQARQPVRELLNEGTGNELSPGVPRRLWSKWIAVLSALGAFALVGHALFSREENSSETFFSSGMLLLIAVIAAVAWLLRKAAISSDGAKPSLTAMALRNCTRRRHRSLATIGLLASGTFLITSIGAFRLDSKNDAVARSSGTGGFALLGETTLPLVQNLNDRSGREFFGINEQAVNGVSFVSFRVRAGDDASCLNLNRAQQPRLLGVKPSDLQERGAFTFAKFATDISRDKGWMALKADANSVEIPAIGDEASIAWAMRKKIGDTIDYTDERGNKFKLRIVGAVANSVLQGSLIIDEKVFTAKFPSESGYRFFLIDAPAAKTSEASKELSRGLQDVGLELTLTTERLAAYNAVQNTYLNTFQVLGALGLLLGSVGLGVVVLRNVLERRAELALLSAVGFRKRSLQMLILGEHAGLLIVGLVAGIASALLAILPSLMSPRGDVPYASLGLSLAAILFSGIAWTALATKFALHGELLRALRNE